MNKIQVKPDHYFNQEYDDLERWISYWHQIHEVLNLQPKSVLEIGPGNKLVSTILRRHINKVVTVDHDDKLLPDVCADICQLPFKANSFDVILCAQVLEHLPFSLFSQTLKEIARVGRQAVISLPHAGPTIYTCIKIPLLPYMRFFVKLPYFGTHRFDGQHYWEIGKRKTPLSKINKVIKQVFKIHKSFIHPESPWYRFFILKRK